jgi:hypothetical protein
LLSWLDHNRGNWLWRLSHLFYGGSHIIQSLIFWKAFTWVFNMGPSANASSQSEWRSMSRAREVKCTVAGVSHFLSLNYCVLHCLSSRVSLVNESDSIKMLRTVGSE